MNPWMTLWTILLAGGAIGMLGLLVGVTTGAVRELKESLTELRTEAESDLNGEST